MKTPTLVLLLAAIPTVWVPAALADQPLHQDAGENQPCDGCENVVAEEAAIECRPAPLEVLLLPARLSLSSLDHQERIAGGDQPSRFTTMGYGPLELEILVPHNHAIPIDAVRIWVDGVQMHPGLMQRIGQQAGPCTPLETQKIFYRWACPPLGRHSIQVTCLYGDRWSEISTPVRFEMLPPTRPEIIAIGSDSQTPRPASTRHASKTSGSITLKLAGVHPGQYVAIEIDGEQIATGQVDEECCVAANLHRQLIAGRYRLTVRTIADTPCGLSSEPSEARWIDLYDHAEQLHIADGTGGSGLKFAVGDIVPPTLTAAPCETDIHCLNFEHKKLKSRSKRATRLEAGHFPQIVTIPHPINTLTPPSPLNPQQEFDIFRAKQEAIARQAVDAANLRIAAANAAVATAAGAATKANLAVEQRKTDLDLKRDKVKSALKAVQELTDKVKNLVAEEKAAAEALQLAIQKLKSMDDDDPTLPDTQRTVNLAAQAHETAKRNLNDARRQLAQQQELLVTSQKTAEEAESKLVQAMGEAANRAEMFDQARAHAIAEQGAGNANAQVVRAQVDERVRVAEVKSGFTGGGLSGKAKCGKHSLFPTFDGYCDVDFCKDCLPCDLWADVQEPVVNIPGDARGAGLQGKKSLQRVHSLSGQFDNMANHLRELIQQNAALRENINKHLQDIHGSTRVQLKKMLILDDRWTKIQQKQRRLKLLQKSEDEDFKEILHYQSQAMTQMGAKVDAVDLLQSELKHDVVTTIYQHLAQAETLLGIEAEEFGGGVEAATEPADGEGNADGGGGDFEDLEFDEDELEEELEDEEDIGNEDDDASGDAALNTNGKAAYSAEQQGMAIAATSPTTERLTEDPMMLGVKLLWSQPPYDEIKRRLDRIAAKKDRLILDMARAEAIAEVLLDELEIVKANSVADAVDAGKVIDQVADQWVKEEEAKPDPNEEKAPKNDTPAEGPPADDAEKEGGDGTEDNDEGGTGGSSSVQPPIFSTASMVVIKKLARTVDTATVLTEQTLVILRSRDSIRSQINRLGKCIGMQSERNRRLRDANQTLIWISSMALDRTSAMEVQVEHYGQVQQELDEHIERWTSLQTEEGRAVYLRYERAKKLAKEHQRRMALDTEIALTMLKNEQQLAEQAKKLAQFHWDRVKEREKAEDALRRLAPDTKTYFHAPAHFPIPRFGSGGLDDAREGITIAEGMKLVTKADGHYEIEYRVNPARVPAVLGLQIHFKTGGSDSPWQTITLSPRKIHTSLRDSSPSILLGNQDADPHDQYTTITLRGVHPALRQCGGRVTQVKRTGTARYGYGFEGLDIYDKTASY